MADEEKVVDAEIQKKEPEKKLTRKEKKEKKKQEKKNKRKHSAKFWLGMMILFVVVLAIGVYLPDYLAARNTEATAAASSTPEETAVSATASAASTKVQETVPPVPSAETEVSEKIYIVKEKETLQIIAQNELGDINLWKEILRENPDLGEIDGSTILNEGEELILPQN